MNVSLNLTPLIKCNPTDSSHRCEIESLHNDFNSLKCNIYSGFTLTLGLE